MLFHSHNIPLIGALILALILLLGVRKSLLNDSNMTATIPGSLSENTAKTKISVNPFETAFKKAQDIRAKSMNRPGKNSVDLEDLRRIASEVAVEKSIFDQAVKDLDSENLKLLGLKNSLNDLIMQDKSRSTIVNENRKLEAQALLLVTTQKRMNQAYMNLMIAQDKIVRKLIVNK